MRDRRKVLIIIGIVFVVLFGILFLIRMGRKDIVYQKKMTNLLERKGFTLNNSLYVNDNIDNPAGSCREDEATNCEGESKYFDIYSYELYMNKNILYDGVYMELTPSYYYVTDELKYTYRITYENGTAIIKGDYDGKDMTCYLEYTHGFSFDSGYKSLCDDIESDIEDFYYYAKLLIKDHRIIEYMKS